MANDRPGWLNVHGVTLEILERGQGRPILWLHGEDGLDPAAPFLDLLAAHGRLVAPSHPGFGHSPDANNIDTVDDLAYLYLDLLAERNLRDVIVIGSSLGGAEDRFVTAAYYGAAYRRAIPGARFETIDGAGHFPHIEEPRAFAERVRGFLAERKA